MPGCKIRLTYENSDPHLKAVLGEIGRRRVRYLDKELLLLTRNYLKACLHSNISKQLRNGGIEIAFGESDFATFSSALERRSLSQLYMIVWQAVQTFSASDLRFFSLSEGAAGVAEQVEDAFLDMLSRYEAKNRAIKPFQYSQKRSTLSLVLFNTALRNSGDYYTVSLRKLWNQYA